MKLLVVNCWVVVVVVMVVAWEAVRVGDLPLSVLAKLP